MILDELISEARLFPYEAGSPDQSGYVDFKARADLIPFVLEDFRQFAEEKAIQTFYSFLKWINGPDSKFETSDCAFRPPNLHEDRNSTLRLSAHGRVFVLYRNLVLNTSTTHSEWLCGKLKQVLQATDPEFSAQHGVVGFTFAPSLHLGLSRAKRLVDGRYDCSVEDPGMGRHVMLSFWGYGNDNAEVFENLNRLFENIWNSAKMLSDEIEATLKK